MKRKKFSREFKAKVAVEAIKGHLTANEIASEYEVHVSQANYLVGVQKSSRLSMNTKAVSSMKK